MSTEPKPVTLTHLRRCGDAEAAYYVNERAVLVRKGPAFALALYIDSDSDNMPATFDGLHNFAGYRVDGDAAEWTPVDTAPVNIMALVNEWIVDGWERVA